MMLATSVLARVALSLALVAPAVLAAGCGDDEPNRADADLPGEDSGGRPAADAAGTGAVCGGFSGATCDEGLYCDYEDNHCGIQDGAGTCRAAPVGCSGEYQPACGCDGEVHSNTCAAQASGVDVSDDGGCEPPKGTFSCGHLFCQADTQYCQVVRSDVSGLPDGYECVTLPEGCDADASCDCLADEQCGDSCTEDEGTFTLTCPGG